MIIRFSDQVPKEFKFTSQNEDSFCWSEKQRIAVISDGASESFDARAWSRLLVKRHKSNPKFSLKWLETVTKAYEKNIDFQSLSWSKQAAYSRGSFASLLSIIENPEARTVEVFSIGDSLGVLIQEDEMIETFPYKKSVDFNNHPELLCTKNSINDFVSKPEFNQTHRITWPIDGKTTIMMMTDALGAWCLQKAELGQPGWEILTGIRHLSDLREIVRRERGLGKMRTDDTTLIVIQF